MSSMYPELTDVLAAYPPPCSDQDACLSFVQDFLKASDHLLVKMQQSTYPVVDAVIKAVHEFSDQNISLKTLASNLHVTPAYLGTIFRQQPGYYFNDYLTVARLKYAAYLFIFMVICCIPVELYNYLSNDFNCMNLSNMIDL